MEHILLDRDTDLQYVNLNIYLSDVKILHNACVDIVNEHPYMIGYETLANKLKIAINYHESEVNKSQNNSLLW